MSGEKNRDYYSILEVNQQAGRMKLKKLTVRRPSSTIRTETLTTPRRKRSSRRLPKPTPSSLTQRREPSTISTASRDSRGRGEGLPIRTSPRSSTTSGISSVLSSVTPSASARPGALEAERATTSGSKSHSPSRRRPRESRGRSPSTAKRAATSAVEAESRRVTPRNVAPPAVEAGR